MATEQINKVIAEGIKLLEQFNEEFVKLGKTAGEFVVEAQKVNEVIIQNSKATKKGTDTHNELNEVQKEAEKINKQIVQTEAKLENVRTAQNKELLRQKQILSDVTRGIKEEIKSEKAQENSINALRNANKKLRQELDNLSLTREENRDRIDAINKEINENTKLINKNSDATRQARSQVGNYKENIKEALGEQEAFGISANKIFQSFTTGAGIVAAASAAIVGLGKVYASSARGAEDLARASDRLNSITTSLGNRIADATGESNIFDKALGFLQQTLLGVQSRIESEIQVTTLSRLRQIEIEEIEQERQKKAQLDRAEVLRQIRDDERKSFGERIAANNELAQVIAEREQDTIAFQEKRLELFKTLLAFDEGNIELQKEIKRIEFEIADAREEAQGFRSEQLINEATLAREASEQQKQIAEQQRIATERQIAEEQNLTEIQSKELQTRLDNQVSVAEQQKLEIEELANFQKENAEDVAETQKEIDEETERRRKELAEQEKQRAIEFGNSIFDFRIGNLDRELQAAEGNEKKQLEIRRKIARAEKQKALFNIAINTAEGIVQALPNLVLAAIVGATGAVQAGIVAAQPIPQFAGGVTNFRGGVAELAEQGPELVKESSGKVWLAENRGLYNLKQGTTVLTAQQTQKELNDKNIVNELRLTRKAIQRQPRQKQPSRFDQRRAGYWEGYSNRYRN